MRISKQLFLGTFQGSSVYPRLADSLLPLAPGDKPGNKSEFLDQLHDDIASGRYFPSIPRGHIIEDKANRVARIIPVFTYRDSCVYYFCIKQLEQYIAVNRVPGTFGGWRLGNPLKEREQEESSPEQADEAGGEGNQDEGLYAPAGAYNPARSRKYWKDFQRRAHDLSRAGQFEAFIKFDIANFYDTIRLDTLEGKIRSLVPLNMGPIIDLMFVLLRNWNRNFEGYAPKHVGLPQEELYDCSRILANFFLQDYDHFISGQCRDEPIRGEYLRYADDQIVMTAEIEDARRLLFEASKELHKIGLNVNTGKVIEFRSLADFDYYWAFELFDLLDDPDDQRSVNEGARRFLEQVASSQSGDDKREWRWLSVLRRLIGIGLLKFEEPLRTALVQIALEPYHLTLLDHRLLRDLLPALNDDEKDWLFTTVETLAHSVPFNYFHLNMLRVYRRHAPERNIEPIVTALNELKYG